MTVHAAIDAMVMLCDDAVYTAVNSANMECLELARKTKIIQEMALAELGKESALQANIVTTGGSDDDDDVDETIKYK